MNNNDDIYKELDDFAKSLIEMYVTARQFKNAIMDDEIIILPSQDNINGVLNWGEHKVKFCGNKKIIRIFPFIVNKAFSCEVYLKLLLKIFNFNINSLKKYERHNLFILYKNTTTEFKVDMLNYFAKAYDGKSNKDCIENQIYNISDTFTHWRYIYEHINEFSEISIGFLNTFCNYLDDYCIKIINKQYKYDVNQDMR